MTNWKDRPTTLFFYKFLCQLLELIKAKIHRSLFYGILTAGFKHVSEHAWVFGFLMKYLYGVGRKEPWSFLFSQYFQEIEKIQMCLCRNDLYCYWYKPKAINIFTISPTDSSS